MKGGLTTGVRWELRTLREGMVRPGLEQGKKELLLAIALEDKPEALPAEKWRRPKNELHEGRDLSFSLEKICKERLLRYEPDEYSGYRRFDLAKLFGVVLYFCKDGDFKTKINKLLFYADFLRFKQHALSITDTRYAHATVRERFRGFSARRIMEYSHNEAGYKATTQGQFISYKHAEDLKDRDD